MGNRESWELRTLKSILWIYIILCLIIAGLNYGYAPGADPETGRLINLFWHFYENWVKTIFIVIGSVLTIRIMKRSARIKRRSRNLLGFMLAALIIHILLPIFLKNQEVYFFSMPLPWTTAPLQLLYAGSSFYQSRFPVWGAAGISAVLFFYIMASLVVVIGTLLFGRRWQCSTLCLFNGFAAEVFSPAMPLLGKKKALKPLSLKILTIARWLFLALASFFTIWWILFLANVPVGGNPLIVAKVENYIYLGGELLMAMFFWVAFLGRGYCYYCPLGTILSFLARAGNQQIVTNRSECIQCGRCNRVCPMTIDIMTRAKTGDPLWDNRCVGCGHCIDACPTETLAYSTRFLQHFTR
ncbi:MAG: 4Fe-4S binding protein [Anaerolineae bacterium]|nr:4Fe-4S binding protein [Anaerolineae bacterium]